MILDELDFPGWGTADPRTAAIIVELKTPQVSFLKHDLGFLSSFL